MVFCLLSSESFCSPGSQPDVRTALILQDKHKNCFVFSLGMFVSGQKERLENALFALIVLFKRPLSRHGRERGQLAVSAMQSGWVASASASRGAECHGTHPWARLARALGSCTSGNREA